MTARFGDIARSIAPDARGNWTEPAAIRPAGKTLRESAAPESLGANMSIDLKIAPESSLVTPRIR